MRILSLWQPWASLIAVGAKRWETRSWRTAYRGPLLIHAGRKVVTGEYSANPKHQADALPGRTIEAMIEALGVSDFTKLPRGHVVALAELADCRRTGDFAGAAIRSTGWSVGPVESNRELLFGNYGPGRWSWQLAHIRRLDPPLEWRGAQGVREVPPWLVERVHATTLPV